MREKASFQFALRVNPNGTQSTQPHCVISWEWLRKKTIGVSTYREATLQSRQADIEHAIIAEITHTYKIEGAWDRKIHGSCEHLQKIPSLNC